MDEYRARVVLQEKGLYTITCDGIENIAEVSGKFRFDVNTVSDYPTVGDYVTSTMPTDGSHSIISSVFPRKSVFVRKSAGGTNEEQLVAANIDTVFVCMSLNKDFNLRRLERYLTVSWDSGAEPVVVLTKADLCNNIDEKRMEISSIAPGVDIVAVSSLSEQYEDLDKYLTKGKTVAFVGSSGVGKSTLINKLTGEETIKTSEIRRDDDKGRHTTTHRELISLANGAYVIDTPGMRELGLLNNEDGMATVFNDIEELISDCRFSNCTHKNEPGCCVIEALEKGELSAERWNSYLKLRRENQYNTNENDYLKQKNVRFKEIAKINKGNKNKKRNG